MQTPVIGSIYGILEGNKQYIIPIYQRIYSWGKLQCERFWTDITEMHRSNKSGHFIGTIVNITEDLPSADFQKFMIIDKQRLTKFD
ncbi:MAG: DUF262 domain-containing protein [Helicobacteraceae bacterium]|jgi:uncharacterized protein with ParB-like and HNH nuclease domain|nr:DUF262 domain-containing protein [Helicobacteraceae bacterium]